MLYRNGEILRGKYNGKTPTPDPRKWEKASNVLKKTNKPALLKGLIGDDITRDFIDFCRTPVIMLEDVLNGNYTEEEIRNLDVARKHATIIGLVQASENDIEKVRDFIKKLGPEFLKIFDALWAHGDENRIETLQTIEASKTMEGGARK